MGDWSRKRRWWLELLAALVVGEVVSAVCVGAVNVVGVGAMGAVGGWSSRRVLSVLEQGVLSVIRLCWSFGPVGGWSSEHWEVGVVSAVGG